MSTLQIIACIATFSVLCEAVGFLLGSSGYNRAAFALAHYLYHIVKDEPPGECTYSPAMGHIFLAVSIQTFVTLTMVVASWFL